MSKKSPSASPEFSVREFFQRFPDDDVCLAHIMDVRFGGTHFECGSCGKESTHYKLDGSKNVRILGDLPPGSPSIITRVQRLNTMARTPAQARRA